MHAKPRFPTELAWLAGLAILALGTAMMAAADFGVSMVVAPAYILYRKLSLLWTGFTFGMAEYLFQAFLLLLMMLVLRRFRIHYLFSFASALLYGAMLDGCRWLVDLLRAGHIAVRLPLFAAGVLLCSLGVALLFHTYLPPEVYELFVKELCARYGFPVNVCKTVYDAISCLVAVVMSFLFFGFGQFVGVSWGTAVCALLNGFLIGHLCRFFDRHFAFFHLFRTPPRP